MSTPNSSSSQLSPEEFFNYWSNLARTDPARFETERITAIQEVIASLEPEKQEAACEFQNRINTELAKEPTPAHRMVRVALMMVEEGLSPLHEKLTEFQEEVIEHQLLLDQLPKDVHELSSTFLATQEAVSKISKS